jgi:hypothetical protein
MQYIALAEQFNRTAPLLGIGVNEIGLCRTRPCRFAHPGLLVPVLEEYSPVHAAASMSRISALGRCGARCVLFPDAMMRACVRARSTEM